MVVYDALLYFGLCLYHDKVYCCEMLMLNENFLNGSSCYQPGKLGYIRQHGVAFCHICAKEIGARNRPLGCLKSTSYKNLQKKLFERIEKKHDKK